MRQPWLHSAKFDSGLILLPPFVATFMVVLLQFSTFNFEAVPVWAWVLFVLFIDVAHVYSTLYRTYFDKEEFENRRELYTMVPMVAFLGSLLLHTVSSDWFWRVLAYMAVFHFVRQQYGFMMLYRRVEKSAEWTRWLDRSVIYLATIYPILYWHTHMPRQFNWFVEGDFVSLPWPEISGVAFAFYLLILFCYGLKEIWYGFKTGFWNVPKNLVLSGTALSWYVGIVWLDADMAFTVTNVVTHGLPYVALIWVYTEKAREESRVWPSFIFGKARSLSLQVVFFYGLLLGLAYVEEGFWDAFIWREHDVVFPAFQALPFLTDEVLKSAAVALLILPQLTHYILDGFIWRVREMQQSGQL